MLPTPQLIITFQCMKFGLVQRLFPKIPFCVAHRQFIWGEELGKKLDGALVPIFLRLQSLLDTLYLSRSHTTSNKVLHHWCGAVADKKRLWWFTGWHNWADWKEFSYSI